MEQYWVIAPAALTVVFWLATCSYFGIRWLLGDPPGTPVDRRTHSKFFAFFMQYFVWLLVPIERSLKRSGIEPNTITLTSIAASAGSGLSLATGHLALAGWLFIAAGGLDVLDGRLARARNEESRSGAFLDSVSDRWSELFVFAGFAYFLRDSYWLGACLLAVAGSIMVSYTRARGEAAGVVLDGGTMQRPERITVISIGTLSAAWFYAAGDVAVATHIVGGALLLVGLGATVTAMRRFRRGYRTLRAKEAAEASKPRPSDSQRMRAA